MPPSAGIHNEYHCCYSSAVVQALTHCRSFRERLLDIRMNRASASARPMTIAIQSFVRSIYRTRTAENNRDQNDIDVDSHSVVHPEALLRAFYTCCPGRLSPGQQNDAQEFLAVLVDRLDTEDLFDDAPMTTSFTSATATTSVTTATVFSEPETRKAKAFLALSDTMREHWNKSTGRPGRYQSGPVRHSWATDVLAGQYVSQVRCEACKYICHNGEVLTQVPIEARSSVSDGLRRFFADESVSGWRCDKCDRNDSGTKLYRCWKLPPVLVLVVRRFDGFGKKDNTAIAIDEQLDLGPYTVPTDKNGIYSDAYDLTAVVCHSGSMSSGHYVAVCAADDRMTTTRLDQMCEEVFSPSWYLYDDESVSRCEAPGRFKQASRTAYLLMYDRRSKNYLQQISK